MSSLKEFKMLTASAIRKLTCIEGSVITLLILIIISSMVWSVSIHVLNGDFNYGIHGAEFVFRERAKPLRDVDPALFEFINRKYANYASRFAAASGSEDENPSFEQSNPPTKISHLFQLRSTVNEATTAYSRLVYAEATENSVNVDFKAGNRHDVEFLGAMEVDLRRTQWGHPYMIHFMNSFPFFSEVVAIIWTTMIMVYQSNMKKYWGLPKPWRIVVPSIIVFFILSLTSTVYAILSNKSIKELCMSLKSELQNPEAISCGLAMTILRPTFHNPKLSDDVLLAMYRYSVMTTLFLWLLAFTIMVLRFVFAIDFQLVSVTISAYKPSPPVLLTSLPKQYKSDAKGEPTAADKESPTLQPLLAGSDEVS